MSQNSLLDQRKMELDENVGIENTSPMTALKIQGQ